MERKVVSCRIEVGAMKGEKRTYVSTAEEAVEVEVSTERVEGSMLERMLVRLLSAGAARTDEAARKERTTEVRMVKKAGEDWRGGESEKAG